MRGRVGRFIRSQLLRFGCVFIEFIYSDEKELDPNLPEPFPWTKEKQKHIQITRRKPTR